MSSRQVRVGIVVGLCGCSSVAAPSGPEPAAEAATPEHQVRRDEQPAADTGRPRPEHGRTCAPGSVTVETAGVCLRLPIGYIAAAPLPGVQRFEASDGPPITLRWLPSTATFGETFAAALTRLAELDVAAIRDTTRDGTGTFVYAVETQAFERRVAHAASTLLLAETIVWCSASAALEGDPPRGFFEACQSLMGNQRQTPGG